MNLGKSFVSQLDASQVTPYHWSDGDKRHRDYMYLDAFYQKTLGALASSLNEIHEVLHDARYWEIILGAWLLTHVSVVFDRFEVVRTCIDSNPEAIPKDLGLLEFTPPTGYGDYIKAASQSHDFNANLFNLILAHARKVQGSAGQDWVVLPVRNAPPPSVLAILPSTTTFRRRIVRQCNRNLRSSIALLNGRLQSMALTRQRVLFSASYIRRTPLVKLQLLLRQAPLLDFRLFDDNRSSDTPACESLRSRLGQRTLDHFGPPENDFERCFTATLVAFLPLSALEDYANLRRQTVGRTPNVRVAVTAISHYVSEGFKIWAAEATERGAKLVIAEHGGSFPYRDMRFGFEERIADVMVPSIPVADNQTSAVRTSIYLGREDRTNQVVGLFRRTFQIKKRELLIAPYQWNEFSVAADSGPTPTEAFLTSDELLTFLNLLREDIRRLTLLKSHPAATSELDVAALLWESFSESCRISRRKWLRELRRADFILCTYPQTTFGQAMLTGKPTVLLFNESLHRVHPSVVPLLSQLREANIVFHEPEEAAEHLNANFFDPSPWWNSLRTLQARTRFSEAMRFSSDDGVCAWSKMLGDLSKTVERERAPCIRTRKLRTRFTRIQSESPAQYCSGSLVFGEQKWPDFG